jgi:photosystem II stability/assembly factor-like uncharacterized protein
MSSTKMKLSDALRAWIVETFTIWRTDDGGKSWRLALSIMNPETDGQPGNACFLNRDDGWVATSKGRVYRTGDGGKNWQVISLAENLNVTDVVFVNQQTGWVAGFEELPPYTKLFHTKDGGKTWLSLPRPQGNGVIASINFVDEREGWIAGRLWMGDPQTSVGALFHTIDGGETWRRIQLQPIEPFFGHVHFIDSQHGWLAGRDNLYRSDDGGGTWRRVLSLPPVK